MPIYEYICNDCIERFSLLRSVLDSDKAAVCPTCGSTKVSKLISSFSTSGSSSSTLSFGSGGG